MIKNYWLFKVNKIIDLKKFLVWARLNLPPEVTDFFGEKSTLEHKWIISKFSIDEKYEKLFRLRLEKELFNVCEYSLQLVLESDIEREKERKAWEAKCKLSDEWFETLDDEHKEFVRVYARHCMPQG